MRRHGKVTPSGATLVHPASMLLAVLLLASCAPEAAPMGAIMATGAEAEPFLLDLPVAERDRIDPSYVMGVDHDPAVHEGAEELLCTAYNGDGYPSCYDEHEGTDFNLAGGFEAMDAGSATITAAYDGFVEVVIDEHYDRCHLEEGGFEVTCDGNPIKANRILLRHLNGWATEYKHLATDSALVEEGEAVQQGQGLALMGSSGWSTAPHLHLELIRPDESRVDPFAGEFSQEATYWCEQYGGDGLPGSCD